MFAIPYLSCVIFHLSHIMCHDVSTNTKKIRNKIRQRGGASWWRVCYQRGLPRLVSLADPGEARAALQTLLSLIN